MRPWVNVLMTGLLVCCLAGCERNRAQEQREAWDPELDGTAVQVYHIEADPSVLNPSTPGSGRAGGGRPSGNRPAPTGTPVEQVRQQLGELPEIIVSRDVDGLLSYIKGGNEFRPLVSQVMAAYGKAQELDKATRDQYGKSLAEMAPNGNSDAEAKMKAAFDAGAMRQQMNLTELPLTQQGNKVILGQPGSQQAVEFELINGRWQIALPQPVADIARQVQPMATDIIAAANAGLDEVIQDVRSGAIAEAEFKARAEEILKKHMDPVMAQHKERIEQDMGQFMGMMMGGMGGSAGPGGAGADPDF